MREWQFIGGVPWGGRVYHHASGAVAHVHYDNGDVRIAAGDLVADQRELPDLDALELIVEDDLGVLRDSEAQAESLEKEVERLLEAGVADDDPRVVAHRRDVIAHRNNRALLLVTGMGPDATFGDHRRRPSEWTVERLVAFALGYVEIGNRWTREHEDWAAREPWNLRRRRVHDVMEMAEDAGIIVNLAPGRGAANVYELTGTVPPDSRARAEWHRRRWRAANASRDELEQAITSGRVRPVGADR